MQKFIDRSDLQIKSVVALDHLKNYIYVEAEKEAHVKEVSMSVYAWHFTSDFVLYLLNLVYAGLQRSTKHLCFGKNNISAYKRNGRCPLC
jgi:hypothetical protein